jgi:hypothetical protein
MKLPENKAITRVVYEYEDGTILAIGGAELQKWLGFNAQVARHAHSDNVNPAWETLTWEDITDTQVY